MCPIDSNSSEKCRSWGGSSENLSTLHMHSVRVMAKVSSISSRGSVRELLPSLTLPYTPAYQRLQFIVKAWLFAGTRRWRIVQCIKSTYHIHLNHTPQREAHSFATTSDELYNLVPSITKVHTQHSSGTCLGEYHRKTCSIVNCGGERALSVDIVVHNWSRRRKEPPWRFLVR